MKNLFLLLIMVSLFGTANSQTTKGTWTIGFHNFSPVPLTLDGMPFNFFPPTNSLGISLGSSKNKVNGELQDDKQNNTVFGLTFNSHYFLADQFAVGLVGNFSSSSTTYKQLGSMDEKSSSIMLLLGPELRYYFDTGVKAKIWLKGGASFGSISSKYDGEKSDPINLSQIGGGAGLSVFPVPAVSIDLGMSYNVLTASQKDSSEKYQSINSGFTLDVGFGAYF